MVTVLAVFLLGATRAPAAEPPHKKLAVVVAFREGYSSPAIEEMKHEVEGVMSLGPVDFEWRDLGAGPVTEVFDHIVVVRFSGDCHARGQDGEYSGHAGLAYAHVSDGQILPFAEVDCKRIRRLILPRLAHRSAEILMGRALGRVVAHELYHILGATRRHGKTGLAKGVISAGELTADHLNFEEEDIAALRERFQPSRSTLAAAAGR